VELIPGSHLKMLPFVLDALHELFEAWLATDIGKERVIMKPNQIILQLQASLHLNPVSFKDSSSILKKFGETSV